MALAGNVDSCLQQTLAAGIVLTNGDVGYMGRRTCIQVHLAGDAREAPEVLIFQIAAVAPAHHLHGYQVLAFLHVFGNVKLGSYLRVLRVTCELAVDPHLEVARGRPYMEKHLLAVPRGGQFEGTAVRAGVIVGLADERRIAPEGGAPGVAHVLIGFVAIALNLEESGHGEVHPLRVVILQGKEVFGCLVVVFDKAEAPFAFHREVATGERLVALHGQVATLEGKEVGPPCLAVNFVNGGILPFRRFLRIATHGSHTR